MSVRERRDRANAKFVKKSNAVKVNSSSTTRPKNNSGTINSGTSIKQRRDRANNATKTIQPKQEYAVSNSYSHAYYQYINSPFNMNNIDKTIQDANSIVGYDGKSKEPYRSRVVNWTKPAEEAKQEQVIQQAEPVEQTPVEESITQPIIPINAQDYQLGEYQVDNTVPNSSIGYVMPPIERKSLEMPQSNDSEQISSVRDFLSGVSSIPAYVYHNKVVPFIDETREKLFGPSEEELARRAAEEEQERLRLEEEARIAREQFVQDSLRLDANQRSEDILARIAAMDTSYVVGRYNGRNLVSGLATPGSSRFIGTNRKQKTNVRGYNILAPWNNWSILDENTTAKSIEDNHFIEGNKHQRHGMVDPSVARYISIDEEGNLLFTDTIPRGIRGQITTGYASTGNLSDSFKRDKSIRYPKVYYNDGTESYPIFSWINPYNLNSVYHPVQAAVLFDLPNGEKSWIIPYGRTANQFYNDVSKIKNITGDDELEFVNFDSRSATGAYGDAGIRYNKFGSYPSLILRRKFGGNIRRSLAKGGRLKARNGEENQQTNIIDLIKSKKPVTYQEIVNAAELAHAKEVQKEKVGNEKNVESTDYTTQSNDNTIVVNNNPDIQQEYNTHLPEFEGDPLIWDKAHSNLASWRNLVSASPYIIASTPLAAGVSGVAGTVGSAIARAAMSSRFAPVAKGVGTGLKWLNRGLTAGFAGHGAYDMSQGKFTPMTALELIGAGNSLANHYYNVETRAIEAAMRTNSGHDPVTYIKANISSMLQGRAGGKKRLYDISKYILLGTKTGNKGYYNSFAYTPTNYYKGFSNRYIPSLKTTTENDIIDAVLYGKTIDPGYGMTKISTGKDFGFHIDHVKEVYPDKLKNIQVYELNTPNPVPEIVVSKRGVPHGAKENSKFFRTIEGPVIDAGGYVEQSGLIGTVPVVKAEDIWGFNPKRYLTKYFDMNNNYTNGNHYLQKLGVNRVYKHVTPIISKAKWQKN